MHATPLQPAPSASPPASLPAATPPPTCHPPCATRHPSHPTHPLLPAPPHPTPPHPTRSSGSAALPGGQQQQQFICKVSDFGLATALEATEQAITGEHWGTVGYMAPEVVTGRCRKASDM